MTYISITNASIHIPVFDDNAKSIRNSVVKKLSYNRFNIDNNSNPYIIALNNINLNLLPGDKLAVLGNNGAGKSSLLRLIAGVYKPTSGNVSIEGKLRSLIDIFVGTEHEATGRENIYLRGAWLGFTERELTNNLEQIIDFADVGYFIDMPIRTWSTGMKLRLAFAISTTLIPEILIMDEWLSVGDDKFQKKAENRLLTILNEAKIFVLATHSMELVRDLCNRAIIIENGNIVRQGDTDEMIRLYLGN